MLSRARKVSVAIIFNKPDGHLWRQWLKRHWHFIVRFSCVATGRRPLTTQSISKATWSGSSGRCSRQFSSVNDTNKSAFMQHKSIWKVLSQQITQYFNKTSRLSWAWRLPFVISMLWISNEIYFLIKLVLLQN